MSSLSGMTTSPSRLQILPAWLDRAGSVRISGDYQAALIKNGWLVTRAASSVGQHECQLNGWNAAYPRRCGLLAAPE